MGAAAVTKLCSSGPSRAGGGLGQKSARRGLVTPGRAPGPKQQSARTSPRYEAKEASQ